jgi:5-hydroxyisourate hydrolase-like protein (transthyretin family)
MLDSEDPPPQLISDALLDHAMKLDQGRPADDITIVVLRVASHTGDSIRRMMIRLPLDKPFLV